MSSFTRKQAAKCDQRRGVAGTLYIRHVAGRDSAQDVSLEELAQIDSWALKRMWEAGQITRKQYNRAIDERTRFVMGVVVADGARAFQDVLVSMGEGENSPLAGEMGLAQTDSWTLKQMWDRGEITRRQYHRAIDARMRAVAGVIGEDGDHAFQDTLVQMGEPDDSPLRQTLAEVDSAVLRQMWEDGCLSKQTYNQAISGRMRVVQGDGEVEQAAEQTGGSGFTDADLSGQSEADLQNLLMQGQITQDQYQRAVGVGGGASANEGPDILPGTDMTPDQIYQAEQNGKLTRAEAESALADLGLNYGAAYKPDGMGGWIEDSGDEPEDTGVATKTEPKSSGFFDGAMKGFGAAADAVAKGLAVAASAKRLADQGAGRTSAAPGSPQPAPAPSPQLAAVRSPPVNPESPMHAKLGAIVGDLGHRFLHSPLTYLGVAGAAGAVLLRPAWKPILKVAPLLAAGGIEVFESVTQKLSAPAQPNQPRGVQGRPPAPVQTTQAMGGVRGRPSFPYPQPRGVHGRPPAPKRFNR